MIASYNRLPGEDLCTYTPMRYCKIPVIEDVRLSDCIKSVISSVYNIITNAYLMKYPLKCREQWSRDIGNVEEEEWSEIFKFAEKKN